MERNIPHAVDELAHQVRDIWNRNADFWDERMGEGNVFHKQLIEPAQLRLLNIQGGERVLDAACGNGQFARKLADSGAQVVAFDTAERMVANARSRSQGYEDRITYHVIDCTDGEQLLTLGRRRFDHVVCTMALMDIVDIRPLISASAQLLTIGGRFTFSVLHPCFNSGFAKRGMEQHDLGGELVEEYFIRTSRYLLPVTTEGLAMVGQPAPQYYFHRPLSALLNTFLAEGFVLDGIEEPAFGEHADESQMFQMMYQHIPPAWVARMRLLP